MIKELLNKNVVWTPKPLMDQFIKDALYQKRKLKIKRIKFKIND